MKKVFLVFVALLMVTLSGYSQKRRPKVHLNYPLICYVISNEYGRKSEKADDFVSNPVRLAVVYSDSIAFRDENKKTVYCYKYRRKLRLDGGGYALQISKDDGIIVNDVGDRPFIETPKYKSSTDAGDGFTYLIDIDKTNELNKFLRK